MSLSLGSCCVAKLLDVYLIPTPTNLVFYALGLSSSMPVVNRTLLLPSRWKCQQAVAANVAVAAEVEAVTEEADASEAAADPGVEAANVDDVRPRGHLRGRTLAAGRTRESGTKNVAATTNYPED